MTLSEVGRALYGSRFQTDLAKDLGVGLRTMQRWAAHPELMPAAVEGELRDLVRERVAMLAGLLGIECRCWKD